MPILALGWIPIKHFGFESPPHDVSALEAEKSIQKAIGSHAIRQLLIAIWDIPVDSE